MLVRYVLSILAPVLTMYSACNGSVHHPSPPVYVPRPPPSNNNRGRFTYRGRGRGAPPNRRARRSDQPDDIVTRDPRVRNPTPITPEPAANVPIETSLEAEEIAFLNEFANADITSNMGDDITMSTDLAPTDISIVA